MTGCDCQRDLSSSQIIVLKELITRSFSFYLFLILPNSDEVNYLTTTYLAQIIGQVLLGGRPSPYHKGVQSFPPNPVKLILAFKLLYPPLITRRRSGYFDLYPPPSSSPENSTHQPGTAGTTPLFLSSFHLPTLTSILRITITATHFIINEKRSTLKNLTTISTGHGIIRMMMESPSSFSKSDQIGKHNNSKVVAKSASTKNSINGL